MDRRTFILSFAATPLISQMAHAQAQEAAPEPLADFVLGDPDAAVEVIEYASFSCIHCARFHTGTYPDLKANYIDPGLIRFVYREVYLNKIDLWAGMLARCAGTRIDTAPVERGYFAFVDMIFKERDSWLRDSETEIVEGLYTLGRKAGMSDDEMTACLQDPDAAEALVKDYQLKAGGHGVRSTPTFVIDGEVHKNMPYDEFAALLDGKLN